MVLRGISIGYLTVIAIVLAAASLPVPDNSRVNSFVTIAVLVTPLFICAQPLRLILKRHSEPTRQLFNDVRAHWSKLLWQAPSNFH